MLTLVNKAIEILGPITALLDTRGVAYLTVGKADLALVDLQEAAARPSRDVKLLRHLDSFGPAHQLAGNTLMAKEWRESHASGIGIECTSRTRAHQLRKARANWEDKV